MGVKVRVKRNIGKDSEEYFGKPNGKVYELTDNFRLVDDDGHEWGNNGFKDEQEFIEHMKNVIGSSTEFEVVKEENEVKLKVGDRVVVNGERTGLEFNNDKGKIVEIDRYGDVGVEFDTKRSSLLHSCENNGKKNSCWYVDEDMVTVYKEVKKEEEKVVNKFKVGDIVKGKANNKRYGFTNKDMTKGEVTKVYNNSKIEVKILEHAKYDSQIGNKYDVESDYFKLVTPPKKSIHLTFDGDTTHAVVKEDGKVVKREKVGLFKVDVYDEATGVREVIDKLYGKRVVEDVKSKFVKAKVGDTIKIVKGGVRHTPSIKIGDTFIVTSVGKDYVESKYNVFFDNEEEYIIIPTTSFSIGDKVKLLDGKGKGRSFVGGWAFGMSEEVGKIATVKEVREDRKSVLLNELGYVWDIDCLELIKPSQISEYTTDELLSEIKKRMER